MTAPGTQLSRAHSRAGSSEWDARLADQLDFDTYRASVASSVVSLEVHSPDPDHFTGRLAACGVGDLRALEISADAHAVHRTPTLVAHCAHPCLKFSVVEQGSGMIVQDGRETALTSGDMAVYDTSRPYSLLFDDRMRLSVVMFPRELLDVPPDLLARLTAVRLDPTTGVGGLVGPYVSSLARQVDGAGDRVARRLLRTAVDMVGTLLEACTPDAVDADPHDALVRRILDYIDENLGRPELDPTQIAAAHFISVRHLHALFSERGTTVSTIVRARRLERCYDALLDPVLVSRSVTTIGLDHGFADAAHFSRTFRARFGVPPSTLRSRRT